jgi:hypothetical protein
LSILRRIHRFHHPQPLFGIEQLDALVPSVLDHGLNVDEFESFEQFLSLPSVRDNALIEVSSLGKASGKTALLSLLILSAISPNQYHGVQLAGKDGAVILFDNDDRFDVSATFYVLKNHIKRELETISKSHGTSLGEDGDNANAYDETTRESVDTSNNAIDSLARKCLQHLHIIRPQSWSSLIASLDSLPDLLLNSPLSHNSAAKAVSYVIVDGASAFLWQRRAEEESRKILALNSPPSATSPSENPGYEGLLKRLRDLGRRFDCPVIITTLQQPRSSENSHRDGNIAAANACLTVERLPVRPFPNCISFEEAWDLQRMRREGVEKHEFRVMSGNHSAVMIMKKDDIIIQPDPQD